VIALGVMNTAITTAASRLAHKEQLGGFYGVMESVENVAGMVGPALGGLLARVDGFPATLVAVVCFYAAAFVLVALFFNTHVSGAAAAEAAAGAAAAGGGGGKAAAPAAPAAINSEQPPSDVPAVPLAPSTPPRPSVVALPAHASPAAARMTVRRPRSGTSPHISPHLRISRGLEAECVFKSPHQRPRGHRLPLYSAASRSTHRARSPLALTRC